MIQRWFNPRLIHENRNKKLPYLNGVHHSGGIWMPPNINAKDNNKVDGLEVYPNGTVISLTK